ncbi:glycosyltransferase [Nocardia sp. alder85J]|uniref:glycosyltransferase n=1 Tax=Nocardia sp. alder85J TaxID=2862949 RepID=UPI001CD7584F|nr:hypothetical protein [Nocardia sp. alder85J]MCX4097760.1 hypothetical protein [Nocardia sp. alder85J]
MTTRVLAAYAPGPGHCNTVLPLVAQLAARPDTDVHLCGSRTVATTTGAAALPVTCHHAGDDTYPAAGHDPTGEDITIAMGRRAHADTSALITRLRPDLIVADTSARGAILAGHDHRIPVLRVVACADAATPTGSAAEAHRRTLIRGHPTPDPTPDGDLGLVAFGPRWFFLPGTPTEPLTCYRFQPDSPPAIDPPAPAARPRALVSFGTFLPEPPAPAWRAILDGLLAAGAASVALKIRHAPTRTALTTHAENLTAGTGFDVTVTGDLDVRRHVAHADILVCHGSATSTLEALAHGAVPIIAPRHNDTFHVAAQCARHHAAVILDWDTGFTPATITGAATTALRSPALAAAVRRFQADNTALPPISALAHHLATSPATPPRHATPQPGQRP